MPNITYIDVTGQSRTVDVPEGHSVMEGARENDVPGIDADCGGVCACATCHVYIDEKWIEKAGPANETEEAMLEFASDAKPTSRLSCQIEVTADLEGLVVHTPPRQG